MRARSGKAGGRPRATAATNAPADDPDAIRAGIEQTRSELDMRELADRADVKTRAKERLAEVEGQTAQVTDRATGAAQVAAARAKDTGQHATGRLRRPAPYAGAVAGLAAAVAAVVLVRRRQAAQARNRRWWSR
jgi:hypothetical protein